MHHLFLDTCVWVDLAVSEFSLVAKLAHLIEDGKATIVVPELIKTEWDGCKKRIVAQITDDVVESRRFAIRFMSFMDELNTDVSDHISSIDPMSTGAKIGAQRIRAIEKILDSDATIRVPVSSQTKTLAIDHALQKKAPFRMRNSMADALIFLTAVEWVNATNPDKSVFVTHNTKDFSDEKRGDKDTSFKERLHPDLQLLTEKNGLEFGVVVGRVLNDIEQSVATKEEIDHGETVVERIRMKDDILERMMSDGVVAKILEEQKKFEEMVSGGAAGKILEEQRKIAEMMSGGTVAKILEEQKKFEEMVSGGAAGKILEEQRKIAEMMSGGTVAKILEEQKKFEEMVSGGATGKILQEQRKIAEMMSGGVVAKILEEQKKFEEIVYSGAAGKIFEEQRKIAEMLTHWVNTTITTHLNSEDDENTSGSGDE